MKMFNLCKLQKNVLNPCYFRCGSAKAYVTCLWFSSSFTYVLFGFYYKYSSIKHTGWWNFWMLLLNVLYNLKISLLQLNIQVSIRHIGCEKQVRFWSKLLFFLSNSTEFYNYYYVLAYSIINDLFTKQLYCKKEQNQWIILLTFSRKDK